MEYWKNGILVIENAGGLFSGHCHPYKKDLIPPNPAFQSTKGGSSTFQYSITPRHKFTGQPISSDPAQRNRISMLD
jgi:hypothetical protein